MTEVEPQDEQDCDAAGTIQLGNDRQCL
jgi:hypothetical protein